MAKKQSRSISRRRAAGLSEKAALGRRVRGPRRQLDTFPAPADCTTITMTSDELTALCPVTGQPDLYTAEITYRPSKLCLESKSLKLYLWSFREEGQFCEALAGCIARDISEVLHPHGVRVRLSQKPRGGISIQATAEVGSPDKEK